MKIIHYGFCFALFSAAAALPAQAATYICQIDGKAVFTTEKTGSNCQPSVMNGSGNAQSAPAGDHIATLWEKEQPGGENDIKILPSRAGSVTNTAEAAAPRVNVKLRNQPKSSRNNKRTPAPVIDAPKPKPALTRKQILQNEVRNEQAALARTKAQLNVARKKGDKTKISRLEQAVRDREANISAIRVEMGR